MEPNALSQKEWSETDFDYFYALLKHAKFDDAIKLINPKTVSIEMLNDLCFEMARVGQGTQISSKIERFRNEESIRAAFKEIPFEFDDLTKINIPKGEILFHLENHDLRSAVARLRQLHPESASANRIQVDTASIDAVIFLLSRRRVNDAVRLAEGLSPFHNESIEELAVEATYRLPVNANSYNDLLLFIKRIAQRYPVIAQKATQNLWKKYDTATFVVSEYKSDVALALLKYVDSIQSKPSVVPFEFRCDLLDAEYMALGFRKAIFAECCEIALSGTYQVKNLPAYQLVSAACEFKFTDKAKQLLEKLGGRNDPLLVLRVAELFHESSEHKEAGRLLELIDVSNLRRYQLEVYVQTLLRIGEMTRVKTLRKSASAEDLNSPEIGLYVLCFETKFKNSEAISDFIVRNEIKLDGDDFAMFVTRGGPIFGAKIAHAYVESDKDSYALDSLGSALGELVVQNKIPEAIQFASKLKDLAIEPNYFRFFQVKELRKIPSPKLSSIYDQLRILSPDNGYLNQEHFNLVYDMNKHEQKSIEFVYFGNNLERKMYWEICAQIRCGNFEQASQAITANQSKLDDDFFVGWAEEFARLGNVNELLKTTAFISDKKKRAANLVYFAGALATERFNGEELIPLYSHHFDLRNTVYIPIRFE